MVIQLHPVTELPGHATEHRRQMRALFRCMVVHLERAWRHESYASVAAGASAAGGLE